MATQRTATTQITSEAFTSTALILKHVSSKIYVNGILWQMNDFLNTRRKEMPSVLTFFQELHHQSKLRTLQKGQDHKWYELNCNCQKYTQPVGEDQ